MNMHAPMPGKSQKSPLEEDIRVGQRIRLRRLSLGMSQEKLGEQLGITFQQIQKYEKGTNRVGASRIIRIAAVFGCQPGDLLDESEAARNTASQTTGLSAAALRIATIYDRIGLPQSKAALMNVARAMVGEGVEPANAADR